MKLSFSFAPFLPSLFCLLFIGPTVHPRTAAAQSFGVDDSAGMFSSSSRTNVEHILANIYTSTMPRKEVKIVTRNTLENGQSLRDLADQIFREERLGGVLILIVKESKNLAVVPGAETIAHFNQSDVTQLRAAMLSKFKQGDFDGGLVAGAEFLQQRLVTEFPVRRIGERSTGGAAAFNRTANGASPAAGEQFTPRSQGGFGLGGILIALLVVGFIMRLVGGFFRMLGGRGFGGGYGGQSYGGGGMFSNILGSMFGAAAGNFMYNRFFRGGGGMTDYTSYNGGQGWGGSDTSQLINPDDSASYQNDNGNTGGFFDGSWGDGSGGGGGGGSDGGSGGGGDW